MKVIIKQVVNSKEIKEIKEMMLLIVKKIRQFLQGKKSISIIVAMIIVGGVDAYLQSSYGYSVPQEVWIFLLGLLGITYKVGNNRVESATKELLNAIKEQNELLKEKK